MNEGWAIIPWWLNSHNELWEFAMVKPLSSRLEAALDKDEFCSCIERQGVKIYLIRHTDPAKSKWVTREEYCVTALSNLCWDTSCILDFSFRGGEWRIVVKRQHGQPYIYGRGDSLEIACVKVLAQLDSLWENPPQ